MRIHRSRLTHLLLFIFASVFLASVRAEEARHFLWQVQGKHNTVYLLGSIHMLPASETLPAAVDRAYADAERLVMEIDMDDLDPLASTASMMQLGLLQNGQTLQDVLGAENAEQLAAGARALGIDPTMLAPFKPWLAAITLSQFMLMKKGFSAQDGVEMRLVARAAQDHKDITGLETLEEQLGFFANMPDDEQADYLMYTLREAAQADSEVDAMLTAWRNGDAEAMARSTADDFDRFPNLYRTLTVDRNRRWINRLEELLRDDDDYLVVVGAIHLVGKDGVVDLLRRHGYRVSQQ